MVSDTLHPWYNVLISVNIYIVCLFKYLNKNIAYIYMYKLVLSYTNGVVFEFISITKGSIYLDRNTWKKIISVVSAVSKYANNTRCNQLNGNRRLFGNEG
jgi:membrane-associated PAP2 superfamily phosphatase